MRRLFTTIFLILLTLSLSAQMSVKSFVELPNDLTARVTAPVTDQNGNTCALIKIVTTETGFTFDVGMLGVQKVEQHPAEIWVYVPERTAKIKIMHPTLGQFDTPDGYYWFPTGNLKSATVYRLTLISGRIITTVEEHVIPTGFLIIKSEPDGADVYLTENGKESYVGTTPFQKKLQYGKYTFRVEKNLYHSEVGIAEINSDKLIMPVTLRPKFGTLQISSNPSGARVVIEGQTQEYTTPCTIDQLPSGKHSIRLLKDRYTPVIQRVTIDDGKTTPLSVTLQPNFALVHIKTLPNAEVYINGQQQGEAVSNRSQTSNQLTVELAEGIYEIEARLASHETVRKQLQVVANQSQTIELIPRPIYGSLDIITTPMEATVTLNGKSYGETPLSISKLLIGEYTLVISKAGYANFTKQITIEKGKTLEVNEKIEEAITSANNLVCSANGVSFEMIFVKGGTFQMGATQEQMINADNNEKPAHHVLLSDYYIGKYEVTQLLWQAVMGSTLQQIITENNLRKGNSEGNNYPMYYISWFDCQEFINKLNIICHKNGTLPADKNFHLPTEAQWEYAARGGNKTKNYKYSGSNNKDDIAWYIGNSNNRVHTIGTKLPNELGIYDMLGNVGEWCSDWYDYYRSHTQTNPLGANSGSSRITRGGNYNSDAGFCRVSNRFYTYSPDIRSSSIGLRLVIY